MILGPFTIALPYVLPLLATLPLLWWLLRATPPAPRRVVFPALRLLAGLRTEDRVSAHTPWWLLALRLLVAALVIIGLSHPLYKATGGPAPGTPLVLVIDDGWAAGPDWRDRLAAADLLLERAERDERPVIVLTTAARPADAPAPPLEARPAGAVRGDLQAMAPHPWGTDRRAAALRLAQASITPPATVTWIHDGIADTAPPSTPGAPPRADDTASRDLAEALGGLGPLTVLTAEAGAMASAPLVLSPPTRAGDGLALTLTRPRGGEIPGPADRLWVRLLDGQGRLIARSEAVFAAGAFESAVVLTPPGGGQSPPARIELSRDGATALAGAGAVVLLDDSWRRRPVGLVPRDEAAAVPLLDPLHYVEKALAPQADLRRGALASLLAAPPAMIVLPDLTPVPADEAGALDAWIRQGGTLIRFAGPRGEAGLDGFLPVRLRGGDRQLGGALSWSEPARLAPFPDHGPFAGLEPPADVTIASQVLAEPEPGLEARTWARLTDGTPLVTAQSRGRGRIVLFHVTADPRWSSLPLSGVFVRMLERVITATPGLMAGGADRSRPLAPWRVLDGFGRLATPGPEVRPLDGPAVAVGADHPPGLYGDDSATRALNLAPSLAPVSAQTKWPPATQRQSLGGLARDRDLMPWLLATALALAVVDLIATLALRGLLVPPRRRPGLSTMVVVIAGLWLAAPPLARAQQPGPPEDAETLVREAALQTRLAYVLTGDPAVDQVSAAGLGALTEVLGRRTSAALAPPLGIALESQDPRVFPLLYWPVSGSQPPLSTRARERVNAYMRYGGLLVIDTRDGGDARALAEGLEIPPLREAGPDHVLGRSFYLLGDFPGRVAGNATWVAADGGDTDGVSPVVIGGNDWAAAWANQPGEGYLFAVTPGGERQREMAYRFGVNLVMYALTGSYKGDQVHLPAILERLTN